MPRAELDAALDAAAAARAEVSRLAKLAPRAELDAAEAARLAKLAPRAALDAARNDATRQALNLCVCACGALPRA